MIRTASIAAVLVSVFLTPANVGAQDLTPSHRAEIVKLMELTGSQEIGNQLGSMIVQQVYAALRKANPNIPERTVAILEEVTLEVLSERTGDLYSAMIPLYGNHFSESEISELVAFYETPIGRKAIRVLPVIMQEVAPISQAWAEALQPELEQRLKARLSEAGLL
jgi:hypothetical protein